jgi:hypothetical protein
MIALSRLIGASKSTSCLRNANLQMQMQKSSILARKYSKCLPKRSAEAPAAPEIAAETTKKGFWFWEKYGEAIKRGFKFVRTLFVGFAIYQAGQANGVAEYARDPEGVNMKLISQYVESTGGSHLYHRKSAEYIRINAIISRILDATEQHCNLKLLHLIETMDRIKIRRAQLWAAAKEKEKEQEKEKVKETEGTADSESKSKVTTGKHGGALGKSEQGQGQEQESQHPRLVKLRVGNEAPVKSIDDRVLGELQSKLKYKVANAKSYKIVAATADGQSQPATIQALHVPQRLELPKPLLTEAQLDHHAEHVLAILAANKVDYADNLTLQELGRLEEECKEELLFWMDIARTSLKESSWNVILSDSPAANAFVTHLLPRKVFVCAGLTKALDLNDDELALVLSHEISHYLLKHGENSATLSFFVNMLRLGLSAVVGFEWFVVVDQLGNVFGNFAEKANSRACEHEADTLGQQIAARACFDTKRGAEVFKKLGDYEEKITGKKIRSSWNSTHPASHERHAILVSTSTEVNKEHLNPQCAGIIAAWRETFMPKRKSWIGYDKQIETWASNYVRKI